LLLKLLITPAMSANCLRMSTLSLQAASVGAVQSRIENRPLFSRYFSGLELIGVNGMHATVEVALREFIQENGGGPGGTATKAAPEEELDRIRRRFPAQR